MGALEIHKENTPSGNARIQFSLLSTSIHINHYSKPYHTYLTLLIYIYNYSIYLSWSILLVNSYLSKPNNIKKE